MNCLKPNPERLERRKYTPHNINLCDWEQVNRIFEELQNRPISSPAALERYYLDVCDFTSALTEEFCRIQLASSVNTADQEARERFTHFNTHIMAPASEISTHLDNRFLESRFLNDLDFGRYGQLVKLLKNSRDLFRKENIPLVVEDSDLIEQYNSLSGGLSVEFDGKTRNLAEMSTYQKKTDRELREKAFRTVADCQLENVDRINSTYDNMVRVRTHMARQAGFSNFRDYQHKRLNRFDYAPEDCERFHDDIEKHVVPLFLERQEKRRIRMNLPVLRPWDLSVDPEGREPLQPFSSQDELITGCAAILDRIYPRMGDTLRLLEAYGNLDLVTRPNKAPVGFNMPFDETGVSFIFMNATGHHNDVVVLLHESGHAIETRACISDPIFQYRHTPQEWGECASQSMELLSLDHLGVFYPDPDDVRRCVIDRWESILYSLVNTARIDAFQHWVYTHPDATGGDRAARWLSLLERFPNGADNSGLEHVRRWGWHLIPHLFIVPFYYIEYGIAQLSAIQVYQKARKERYPFLEHWLQTMKLGYSQPIPVLYEKAGLEFVVHGDRIPELIRFVSNEIDRVES